MKPLHALVTGAEGALGQVVAKTLIAEGCQVTATYHSQKPASLSEFPGVEWLQLNLSDSSAVKAGVQSVLQKRGGIQALIHCAGGFRYAAIDETSDADLDFLIGANFKSAFLMVREVLPAMKKAGFGRIVLVSSAATAKPGAGVGAYAATKAGLNMLVQSVAEEVKDFDININAVAPTMIDTEANRQGMPGSDFSKWVPKESLAEIMVSLIAPWGKSVNGAILPVAGRL